jgi:hypothetical protein
MTSIDPSETSSALFVGIVATACLDLWAVGLNRAFGLPKTNWGHVGRWVTGITSGTFRHESIALARPVAHERVVGWVTHYLIGILYATVYLTSLTAASHTPGVKSAIAFGAVTVLAPWLILQPGLGAGYFARQTPKPNLTRALNVLSHLVFGFGLYVGWTLQILMD